MIAQLTPQYIRTRPKKAISRLISYAFFEGRPATTKGRWMNPFVLSNLKRISENKKHYKKVDKPIFILGTGRSGTTILGLVLSMHRDIGYLNEPKAIWHLIHPQEDVIGSYTKMDAYFRLSTGDVTDEISHRAHQLFGAYLSTTKTHRVVDKYPELIFRIEFVRSLFANARFILLVRNGWDTCHSIATWSERFGVTVDGETHDWWGVDNRKWNLLVEQLVNTDEELGRYVEEIKDFDRHIDRASVEWVITMREGLKNLEKFPDCILPVAFEDLTSDPIGTLNEISEFCNLPMDQTFIEYAGSILHTVPSRKTFNLHHIIEPIFYDTMKKLEYNS
ncbi:sulfotransferase [Candidatus Poribacteria bacterium]|nr:MAG: sulfotransferase [Candidatus Poribacteria bacterium]